MSVYGEIQLQDDCLQALQNFLYSQETEHSDLAVDALHVFGQASISSAEFANTVAVTIYSPKRLASTEQFRFATLLQLFLVAFALGLQHETHLLTMGFFSIRFFIGMCGFFIFSTSIAIASEIYMQNALRFKKITTAPIDTAIYDHETLLDRRDYYESNVRFKLMGSVIQANFYTHVRADEFFGFLLLQIFENIANVLLMQILLFAVAWCSFEKIEQFYAVPLFAALTCFFSINLPYYYCAYAEKKYICCHAFFCMLNLIACLAIGEFIFSGMKAGEESDNFQLFFRWFLWCSTCRALAFFNLRLQT